MLIHIHDKDVIEVKDACSLMRKAKWVEMCSKIIEVWGAECICILICSSWFYCLQLDKGQICSL